MGKIAQILLLMFAIHTSTAVEESIQTTTPDATGQNCTYSGPMRCPDGFICRDFQCFRRCFFLGKCPADYTCEANFYCVKKEKEICAKDEECPPGKGCMFNECRSVECRSNEDCAFNWPCVVGKCFSPTCEKEADNCPEGWKCGPMHRCTKHNDTKKHAGDRADENEE